MPINGWTLVGKDPNSPSTVFTEGQQIQVVWTVTTAGVNGGAPSVVTIPLTVTVKYVARKGM
jgi:hypothetical protein